MKKIAAFIACCLLALVCAQFAHAQTENYPVKALRMISPFPPGGSVDTVARLVGAKLGENLGQQVIIDNRSGASGNIGTEMAARAAPDGYTLLINTLPLVTNGFLFGRVPYDVVNDFAPISLLSSSPSMLAVHPSVPARSVRELLQLAKTQPGKLNYGGAGVGTNPHIAGELFNLLGKVNIVVVQFKGGGPALIATIGGEIGVSFSGVGETGPYVEAGRLRALGVTGLKRFAALPNTPTISEAGLPGYEFSTWHVLLVPKATPRPVVALLADKVKQSMRAPDFVKPFEQKGYEVIASTPEEAAAHLKSELAKWGKVIKERGMRAD